MNEKCVGNPSAEKMLLKAYENSNRARNRILTVVMGFSICLMFYRLSYVLKEIGVQMNHHTLTVAGDSVGGNMAIAMEFMTKERKGPRIQKLPLQGNFGMQVPP